MKRGKDILKNVPRIDEENPKTSVQIVQKDINSLLTNAMHFRQTTSGTEPETVKIKEPRLELLKASKKYIFNSENESNQNTPQSTASISTPPFSPLTPLNLKINKQHKHLQLCESNPDTPDTQHSISPPAYSPLTPLILLKRKKEQQIGKEELNEPNLLSQKSKLSLPVSPQIETEEPVSSPLPSMSPQTKELFDVLNDSFGDINNDLNYSDFFDVREDIAFGNGSDDSVNDPDFNVNIAEDEDDSDTESNESVNDSDQNISEKENEYESDETQENSQNFVIKNTVLSKNKKEYNIENSSDHNSIAEPEKEEELRLSITKCKNDDANSLGLLGKENQTQLQTTKNNIEDNTDCDDLPLPEKETQLLTAIYNVDETTEDHNIADPENNKDLRLLAVRNKEKTVEENNSTPPEKEEQSILLTSENNSENILKHKNTVLPNKVETQLLTTETGIMDTTENQKTDFTIKQKHTQLLTTKNNIEDNTDSEGLLPEKETQLLTAKHILDNTIENNNIAELVNGKELSLLTVRNKENTIKENKSTSTEKEEQTPCKDTLENNSINLPNKEEETQLLTIETDVNDKTNDDSLASPSLLTSNDKDVTGHNSILHQYTPEKETETRSLTVESNIEEITEKSNIPNTAINNDKISSSTSRRVEPNYEESEPMVQIPENCVENEGMGEDQIENAEITGRPKKGRKRKHSQTRAERKERKYNNLEYTTTKYRKVEPKTFIDHKCTCLKKCDTLVSLEKRKQVFEKYVHLGSYNAQLTFIASLVKENRKKRSYTMVDVPPEKKKPKQFVRTYTLSGVEVCREMFLKTLQITTQKITITLKKMRNHELLNDKRGKSVAGWNKISEEDFNFVFDVISRLPKYESHYRREKNSDALYLQPGMTVSKIYEQYQKEFINKFGKDRACVSLSTFKHIFMTKFNLRCKSLKKDTCNKCDSFAVKIQNANSSEEKAEAENEKMLHLEKATKLRDQMNKDFEEARTSDTTECLSFDLEKTLPLPRIPTNIAFYKRQLWLYNSGIHSASDDIGHCYIWVEGEAGRGAQEVGSCLIKYLTHKLRPTVEHLILWSDCCGGQNRNIKVILMLKAYLNEHPKLKTISFRYLESGHTFLPNDTDFSKIETALKNHQRLYTPEDYIDVIKTAKKKNPFQIYKMQKTDFYSVENIEKNIVNRKKFTDKSKVNWLQTKEILIKKDELYSIFMRTSMEEEYKELRVDKKIKGEVRPIDKADMQLLWPNGKPIAPAKLADLESMYHLIPNDCISFYKQLKASDQISDDVDGYGGQLDFELDDMEN